MKKTVKSVLGLCMAAALLSASGCADTSWSFKSDYETLSNGIYIYYTYSAYTDAYSQVEDTSVSVLDQTVEDEDAETWILNKAEEECIAHLTMTRLINENNVEIDEDDLATYEDYADSIYEYYFASSFEALGVSEESYRKCTGTYSAYSEELFKSIYDIGGTSEVSQDELEDYFTENYTYYTYFYLSLTTTDDDGETVDIDDDERALMEAYFAEYKDMINTDGSTMDDVIAQYQEDYDTDDDPSVTNTAILSETSLSEDLQAQIEEMEEGTADCIELDSYYYFIYKGNISDQLDTIADDSDDDEVISNRLSIVHDMKDDEYDEYLEEEKENTEYEINDACISKYTVQRVINIINSLE